MALSNTIFSPTHSRPISRQARFPAQIPPPDLSLALFGDRRKFVEGVMPLLTLRSVVMNLELKRIEKQLIADSCVFVVSLVRMIDLRSANITFTSLFDLVCSIRNRVYASINSTDASSTPSYPKSEDDEDFVPMPMVLIDQDADPEATIVQLSFGDRLGALIDTMRALKDLGLDVIKGTVTTKGSVKQTRFSITKLDTGRKVEDPDLLEQIRLTIINNLLKYHPECSEQLAMGETFGIKAPEKKVDVDIATHIHVKEDGPKRSLLCIETADRPGLVVEMIKVMADINIDVESAEIDTEECSEQLAMGETFGIKAPEKKVDVGIATHIHVKEDGPKRSLLCIETADRPGLVVEMIKVMADINIDVESAEIDTEGLVAKDKFHVSYQGQALNRTLSQGWTELDRVRLDLRITGPERPLGSE
ncbi:hypothetical protein DY000_02000173 [Brassica cretica]|uniref:ACT domain-containing protein ACR n=1 Tax=Brassica cretica TaxID=69181 RepID=A0ABQ7CN42_BRACR|nr:hypothetical protein DY000_02000173 [Brassica cretica]